MKKILAASFMFVIALYLTLLNEYVEKCTYPEYVESPKVTTTETVLETYTLTSQGAVKDFENGVTPYVKDEEFYENYKEEIDYWEQFKSNAYVIEDEQELSLYNQLTEECYKYLLTDKKMKDMTDLYRTNLSQERAVEVAKAVRYSHPYFFFLTGDTYYQNDMIEGKNGKVAMCLFTDLDVENEKNILKIYLDNLNLNIAKKDTKKEILRKIHDYVCQTLTYTKQEITNRERTIRPIIESSNEVVCAGYALTFQLYCTKYDIPCTVVESPSHAWNMVKVGKKYYFIDCTFDDKGTYTDDTYFLSGTDEQHIINQGDLGIIR